jgi:hypothetical protein
VGVCGGRVDFVKEDDLFLISDCPTGRFGKEEEVGVGEWVKAASLFETFPFATFGEGTADEWDWVNDAALFLIFSCPILLSCGGDFGLSEK